MHNDEKEKWFVMSEENPELTLANINDISRPVFAVAETEEGQKIIISTMADGNLYGSL